MADEDIVKLYNERYEEGIRNKKKYSFYLYTAACNILGSRYDSQESVSNAYSKVWNTIPPNQPLKLIVISAM